MFQDETILLLKQLYEWLVVDPTDIDEAKYLLLKKFSEVWMPLMKPLPFTDCDVDGLQYWQAVGREAFICARREQPEWLF